MTRFSRYRYIKTAGFAASAIAILSCLANAASAGENEWMGFTAGSSYLKLVKAQGRIITKFECREPKNKFLNKVEMLIVSEPNTSKREWAAYAYSGTLDYKPGPPSQWNQWRRISVSDLWAAGRPFRCSLFYKK